MKLAIFVSWLGFATTVQGADFCSLIVKVLNARSQEVEAPITVTEQDGRTIERESRPGGSRFCDLGITPVKVTVGDPNCNQVIVKNVGLEWGVTTILPILYHREPCLIDFPPVAACKFLLRFEDSDRNAVQATVKIESPYPQVHRADPFGRVLITIAAYKELRAVASRDGYVSSQVVIPCTTENRVLERRITLRGR